VSTLKRSVGSLVDQVLLSALNFGIAFALIQGISKAEYGLYVQLWLFGLLATAVADALLGNSFNILNNRSPSERPQHLLTNSYRLSLLIALAAALLGSGLSLWLTQDWTSWADRLLLSAVYAVYLLVLVSREFKRVCFYLTERWQSALMMDAIFATCSVALLGLLWVMNWLNVTLVLVALTAASAVAALLTPSLVTENVPAQRTALFKLAETSWSISSWALPGAMLGWCVNNVYLFVLSQLLGSTATAEANASKLAIMPLALTLVAWYQVSRADISRLAQSSDSTLYTPFIKRATLLMYAPVAIYTPLFILVYPWLEPLLVSRGYTHMDMLIALWFVSAALAPLKVLGTSMLVGFEAFKPLFKLSIASLLTQMVSVVIVASYFGLSYVPLALIAADLLEIAVMWFHLLPRFTAAQKRQGTV